MKVVLILVLTVASWSAFADQTRPASFDMKLTGVNGKPPHANVSKALREMIAGFIQDLHVKKYVLLEKPADGGFHVCLDPVDQAGYDRILFDLQTISVGSQAIWDVQLIEACP